MISAPFQIAPLNAKHNLKNFNSSSVQLNRYLHEQVKQDIKRRITACFIASPNERKVAGFYTLASSSLLLKDLPTSTGKKLPRYPTIPAIRMGRLAVDQEYEKRGLGSALLADALDRAIRSEIANWALLVDAKDEVAASFYRYHGFINFQDYPLSMFLPLKNIDNKQP